MPLRSTLLMILVATVLSALALAGLLLGTAPQELEPWGRGLVYGLVLLLITGFSTTGGTMLRRWRHADGVALRQLLRSLRQGILLGLLVVGALWLSHGAWLNTWSVLILVCTIAFLELLFLLSRSRAT